MEAFSTTGVAAAQTVGGRRCVHGGPPVVGPHPRGRWPRRAWSFSTPGSRALERVTPLLERLAAKIVRVGAPGTGHITKVLNNFLNGVALAATCEVMVAGRRAGLDLKRLLEALNAALTAGKALRRAWAGTGVRSTTPPEELECLSQIPTGSSRSPARRRTASPRP
ncbi:MAG TPA: NAD-binding protein [Solirubrobacteraceae bacterium]|nr:NAD-binding protein [Solirubrobacteraceae bacterium]